MKVSKTIVLLLIVLSFVFSSINIAAQESKSFSVDSELKSEDGIGIRLMEITEDFSGVMRRNAAYIGYYAHIEKTNMGTYPILTGEVFASKVKSGAEWDYKIPMGVSTRYLFNGNVMTGEDIGNMHYGFTGRAAGFSQLILRSVAGAYQIYSGTAHWLWYRTYFDDPNDQRWIDHGINLWDNASLPHSLLTPDEHFSSENLDFSLELSEDERREIEERVMRDFQLYEEMKKEKEKELK